MVYWDYKNKDLYLFVPKQITQYQHYIFIALFLTMSPTVHRVVYIDSNVYVGRVVALMQCLYDRFGAFSTVKFDYNL